MARNDSGWAFGLAGGCVAVIGAAFLAAAVSTDMHGRLIVLALAAGVIAARTVDWRACLGSTAFAALVYVGFLAGHQGVLTGDEPAWAYTLVIGFAALLGRGQRWMHAVRQPHDRLQARMTRH
ncbi:hypothetical protein HH310_27710 [Actinoplanes sp. TBRC 11911]|uniref:hypothetical protein n=1 Tax=Actinoplanes sp. TBRC 11911 TaxID=2729386 RepID=UPI00145F850F|nr:hypothetical protein [Actinoplanes sp. TBRC 11911]NMO54957.1 hypothetical protein [Actinoplanes sp. TBRC 11911]